MSFSIQRSKLSVELEVPIIELYIFYCLELSPLYFVPLYFLCYHLFTLEGMRVKAFLITIPRGSWNLLQKRS